jgi:arginyl-tRNA--protein-N-Asp/Glu arginylyltransferase
MRLEGPRCVPPRQLRGACVTSSLRDLKVYTTYPHRCSYLEGEEATTLFIDPRQNGGPDPLQQPVHARLPPQRQPHLPAALQSLQRLYPARDSGRDFTPSRSQRRCLARNADLTVANARTVSRRRELRPVRRYIRARHADGDMYPPDRDQFESFPQQSLGLYRVPTQFREGRVASWRWPSWTLMLDGLSAIYTFYDPEEEARSLGRYAILWQIQRCRGTGQALRLPGLLDPQLPEDGLQGRLPPLESTGEQPVAALDPEGLIESY